jgi:hypothetical protein
MLVYQRVYWLFNIAIENGPVEIVMTYPLKMGGFSIAM